MTTYRIVVGVDGSEGSLRALAWAVHEAHERGGSVQAVMAYDWAGNEAAMLAGLGPDDARERAEQLLTDTVDSVRQGYRDVPIAAETLLGDAAHKLAEASRDADLLVVGSHGHSHLHQAVLGSVSEGCVRLSHCPIVVVPTPHVDPSRGRDVVPAPPSDDQRPL